MDCLPDFGIIGNWKRPQMTIKSIGLQGEKPNHRAQLAKLVDEQVAWQKQDETGIFYAVLGQLISIGVSTLHELHQPSLVLTTHPYTSCSYDCHLWSLTKGPFRLDSMQDQQQPCRTIVRYCEACRLGTLKLISIPFAGALLSIFDLIILFAGVDGSLTKTTDRQTTHVSMWMFVVLTFLACSNESKTGRMMSTYS